MTDDLTAVFTASLSRRRMIIGTGLSAAALAGLSACGSGGSAAGPAPAATPVTGGVSAPTSDIPVGGGKIFADAQTVVTQPTKGEFKAFTSICTHAKCPVADVTTSINCNCHGSKFSITDGSVINPPATEPLAAKTVTVTGSTLTVA